MAHNRDKNRLNVQKWMGYGVSSMIGLASLGVLYQAANSRKDLQGCPPPGKRVDVGGYALHINCVGEGHPTVVLDAGLSHNALVWSLVQPKIAEVTKVCSYDRAGYGWSDQGPKPRTSHQIARELYRLLQNAAIRGPYILVGHSFGGLNVRVFADMYPDDVVGMILVDAAHEDQRHRMPQSPYRTRLMQKLHWQWFRLSPLWARLGILRLRNQPNCVFQELPPQIQELATIIGLQTGAYDWILGEAAYVEDSETEVRLTGTFDNLPLTVLSARLSDKVLDQSWQELQVELTHLSTNTTHIIAEIGGHCLHIDNPEIVIKAIQQMVKTVRSH